MSDVDLQTSTHRQVMLGSDDAAAQAAEGGCSCGCADGGRLRVGAGDHKRECSFEYSSAIVDCTGQVRIELSPVDYHMEDRSQDTAS